jgi:hypothetical protein
MSTPPIHPKIFHITHIDNLASIANSGVIEADSLRVGQGSGQTSIGMTEIKQRRMLEIDVHCHPETKVGEYVPFYFCPRSIMLYILYMGNHKDIGHYQGGQEPILHLQVDVESAIKWMDREGLRWAFSDRNAGSYYADFFKKSDDLVHIDWEAVASTDFRHPRIKDGKQAEFLIHDTCPWHFVEKIGVLNKKIYQQVNTILRKSRHKPLVAIEKKWYY